MATNFGEFISGRRKMLGWSQNELGRQLGCTWIAQIARGERPPPLDELEVWAKKLNLSEEDKALFYELAWQRHSHEKMREIAERLRATIIRLRRQMDAHEARAREDVSRIAELGAMIEALKKELDLVKREIAAARAAGFKW